MSCCQQSPEVEPEISVLLHVCNNCKTYLVNVQVSKAEKELKSLEIQEKEDVISRLVVVNGNMQGMQGQIAEQLEKVCDVELIPQAQFYVINPLPDDKLWTLPN